MTLRRKFRMMLALALSLVLMVPAGNLAHAGSFEGAQSSTSTNGTDGKQIIPIYGYIGPDTSIVDPDPENPDVKPESEIYVEVPVKVLFAAFESDAGAITSPDYSIKNLSTVSDVKVEIAEFAQTNGAEAKVDGDLSLDIVDSDGSAMVSGVFPADYSSAKLFKEWLSKSGGALEFGVGGSWSGGFNTEIAPVFDMTLAFSVVSGS